MYSHPGVRSPFPLTEFSAFGEIKTRRAALGSGLGVASVSTQIVAYC